MALRIRWTGRRARWAKLVSQAFRFVTIRSCYLLSSSLRVACCLSGNFVPKWRYLLGRLLTNYFPRSIWWWRVFTALTWRIARAVELTWRIAQGIELIWRIERLLMSIYLERIFGAFSSVAFNSICVQFGLWIERASQALNCSQVLFWIGLSSLPAGSLECKLNVRFRSGNFRNRLLHSPPAEFFSPLKMRDDRTCSGSSSS